MYLNLSTLTVDLVFERVELVALFLGYVFMWCEEENHFTLLVFDGDNVQQAPKRASCKNRNQQMNSFS